MFCPQCSHQQVSDNTRFCSRCGLSLGVVSELLTNSDIQLKREKREATGIALIMATLMMLLNFLIVFGVTVLPHLANRVFFWIWISFVITSLTIGALGVTNLIRGGLFKRLKERDLRLQLMKFEKERQLLIANNPGTDTEAIPRLFEAVSVTETTTRELETSPRVKTRDFS